MYILIYIQLAGISNKSNMVSQTKTKLYKVESKSPKTGVKTYRHSIFLEKGFVEDSSFPFEPGENLIVKINRDKLIVTKVKD
jgi:hypothetical protein